MNCNVLFEYGINSDPKIMKAMTVEKWEDEERRLRSNPLCVIVGVVNAANEEEAKIQAVERLRERRPRP